MINPVVWETDLKSPTLEEIIQAAKSNFPEAPFNKIELMGDQGVNGGVIVMSLPCECHNCRSTA